MINHTKRIKVLHIVGGASAGIVAPCGNNISILYNWTQHVQSMV